MLCFVGLQRQETLSRHVRVLGQMLPNSFKYAYLGGIFSMDPAVADSIYAVKSLNRALYGVASNDNSTTLEDFYMARVEYAKALSLSGNYSEAAMEAIKLLETFPIFDFHQWFLMNEIIRNDNSSLLAPVSDQFCLEDVCPSSQALFEQKKTEVQRLYSFIQSFSSNHYSGFVPTSSWTPTKYTEMIDVPLFLEHVRQREPFIISFGDLEALNTALNWKVNKWTDVGYLLQKVHILHFT